MTGLEPAYDVSLSDWKSDALPPGLQSRRVLETAAARDLKTKMPTALGSTHLVSRSPPRIQTSTTRFKVWGAVNYTNRDQRRARYGLVN